MESRTGSLTDQFSELARAVQAERWSDLPGAARSARAEVLAAPLVEAVRACVADARGPDWPEQAYDSYSHQGFLRDEWGVTVPFAVLTGTVTAAVPVAAAERILGLPEGQPEALQAWERLPPGRFYRRYWGQTKRYLCLVAEIAARFPHDGGERLARKLRAGLRWLPAAERTAVELQMAVLGLLDDDPARLAQQMLAAAEAEDLGTRGELVHHALRGAEGMAPAERTALLRQARTVARRTTVFVASNPYAAVVEALAADEVGSVTELIELVERAVGLRAQEWDGWDRALQAAGRSLSRLAATYGEAAVSHAREALGRYQWAFPAIDALLLLAGARGLPLPRSTALANEALRAARLPRPSPECLVAEVQAAALLTELGHEGGLTELRGAVQRMAARPAARGHQRALYEATIALGRLAGQVTDLSEAAAAAAHLRERDLHWLAHLWLATAPGATPELAAACLAEARLTGRRWLLRRGPLAQLALVVEPLLAEPPGPLLRRLVELSHEVVSGGLAGHRCAQELAALGADTAEPGLVKALAGSAEQLGESWWRLPILALATDGAAAWVDRQVRGAG